MRIFPPTRNFEIGDFTRYMDAATGTQSITVGFKPRILIIFAACSIPNTTQPKNFCIGIVKPGAGVAGKNIHARDDGLLYSDNTYMIKILNAAGTVGQTVLGSTTTVSDTGCTLEFTKNGSPASDAYRFVWLALG